MMMVAMITARIQIEIDCRVPHQVTKPSINGMKWNEMEFLPDERARP